MRPVNDNDMGKIRTVVFVAETGESEIVAPYTGRVVQVYPNGSFWMRLENIYQRYFHSMWMIEKGK